MNAIQLYTLRNLDQTFEDILRLVAEGGFDGVEYAYRVPDADAGTVRETLSSTGLDVPAAHVPIEKLEDDLEATVKRYRALECERLVVPYLENDCFTDRDVIERTAHRLDTLADRAADHDYRVLYHNHNTEFSTVDGERVFDVLATETSHIGFELDIGLAADAGVEPASIIEKYAGRIELLHCTDTDLGTPMGQHASFGTGDVDYEQIFAAAETAGIEWYIYENGSTETPYEELKWASTAFLDR